MADINFVGASDKPDVFLGDKASTPEDGTVSPSVHLSDEEEKILSKAYLKLDMFFLTSIVSVIRHVDGSSTSRYSSSSLTWC